jgi:CheY-like chemotaxis protein
MTLQAPKPRVLVVDDNTDAADTLASLLTILGCTANVAYSGVEALALGDVLRPHVVILDIAMPSMNGCETARRMRARPWGRQAYIAALSAWGDEASQCCTKEAGMDFHLTKPITADRLLAVLASIRA